MLMQLSHLNALCRTEFYPGSFVKSCRDMRSGIDQMMPKEFRHQRTLLSFPPDCTYTLPYCP